MVIAAASWQMRNTPGPGSRMEFVVVVVVVVESIGRGGRTWWSAEPWANSAAVANTRRGTRKCNPGERFIVIVTLIPNDEAINPVCTTTATEADTQKSQAPSTFPLSPEQSCDTGAINAPWLQKWNPGPCQHKPPTKNHGTFLSRDN